MTREERVFEFMKAIAPVIARYGMDTMRRIVEAGGDQEKCKIDGMSIMEAYAQTAKDWAEAFAKASE